MKGLIKPKRLSDTEVNEQKFILSIDSPPRKVIRKRESAAYSPNEFLPVKLVTKPDEATWDFSSFPEVYSCWHCERNPITLANLIKDGRFGLCPTCRTLVYVSRTYVLHGEVVRQ